MVEIPTLDGRFLLRTSDVRLPTFLHECDNCTGAVEIIDTAHQNILIATLRDVIAARMFWLFDRYSKGVLDANRFNCFNAIHALLGLTNDIEWEPRMNEQGEKMYVDDAAQCMNTPFVFQICGKSRYGIDADWNHEVIHSGLVLGTDRSKQPVVCDKDTHRCLRIGLWSAIWPNYFPNRHPEMLQAEYVTCFPVEEIDQVVFKPVD